MHDYILFIISLRCTYVVRLFKVTIKSKLTNPYFFKEYCGIYLASKGFILRAVRFN